MWEYLILLLVVVVVGFTFIGLSWFVIWWIRGRPDESGRQPESKAEKVRTWIAAVISGSIIVWLFFS